MGVGEWYNFKWCVHRRLQGKVICEPRTEEVREQTMPISSTKTGGSKCKGPEVRVCLRCSRKQPECLHG